MGTVEDPRFKIDFGNCDQVVGAEEIRGQGGIPAGYQVCSGEPDLRYLTQASDAVGIEWIKAT